MIFFLDENFPKSAVALLQDRGHEAMDIRGSANEGCGDQDIFAMAQEAGAVFLTTDRDFFHTVPQLVPDHCGVVVIALRQPNRDRLLSRLRWFLEHVDLNKLHGQAYLLRDDTYVHYPEGSE